MALLLVLCGLGACSGGEEEKPEETLYPITLSGTEIRVGETTVQALLDKGFKVTWCPVGIFFPGHVPGPLGDRHAVKADFLQHRFVRFPP